MESLLLNSFRLKKSKKGLNEIVTYLLILFLSVIVTTGVYFYVNSSLEDQIVNIELSKMEETLILTHNTLNFLQQNPSQSESVIFSFKRGNMIINGTQIRYISEVETSITSSTCVNICYDNFGGFRSIFINVSEFNNATLTSSQILNPDTYRFYMIYNPLTEVFGTSIE